MNSSADTIKIPIEARSIFRVLAIRKVVTHSDTICELCNRFDEIKNSIELSKRIADEKKDFLGYKKRHDGKKYSEETIEEMPETHMCKSPDIFFNRKITVNHTGSSVNDSSQVKFIDYQVPLNESRDSGEGVIDLLGVSGDNKTIYIVEVKKWDSDEHPLRAMFEALTFWKMTWKMTQDGKHDYSDFVRRYNTSEKRSQSQKLPGDENLQNNADPETSDGPSKVVPAILIRKGSDIYNQMMLAVESSTTNEKCKKPECPDCQDRNLYNDPYTALYKKILNTTDLHCWCYDKDLVNNSCISDFTEEFKERLSPST